MLHASMPFFLLTLVAALFGFAIPADPGFSAFARFVAATFLGVSLLVFVIDWAWGAYVRRRTERASSPQPAAGVVGAGLGDAWRSRWR